MKKNFFISLYLITMLIATILGITVFSTFMLKNNNKKITEEMKNIDNKLQDIKSINETLTSENENLKNNNADKLEEYYRWIRKSQEIKKKID